MWNAHIRSLQVSPPTSLEDMQRLLNVNPVTLRCFARGCIRCSEFETEERLDYESKHMEGRTVVPWDCTDSEKREFAMRIGVENVPSYVHIPARGRRKEDIRVIPV